MFRHRSVRPAVALVISAFLALAAPAAAQLTTGALTGTLKDMQGLTVPGAMVMLTSETRGTKVAPALTSATGDFVVPNVAADTYTVEVTLRRSRLKRQGVSVHPGDRVASER